MAAKIGVKIELEGAPQYIANMNKLTAQTKLYQAQMKRVQQELSNSSAFQKSIATSKALGQQLESLQNKAKYLQEEIAKEVAKNDELSSREIYLRTQYENLQTEILETSQALKEQGGVIGAVGTQMQETGDKLKSVGEKMSSIGDSLTTKISTPLAALGGASVKTAATFDSSMSQVAATMGYTVDEINDKTSKASKTMEQLSDFAQQMGKTTAFSASEAAEALNYMALAGYDAQTSMKMLPTVLNLAAAGNMDLATASDMVTDAQSALGLSLEETSKMVDEMAKTSSKSNTSVSQLGEAMLTIGATAANMTGGTTELATALGVLADNGIKGAEGGTKLRNMILSLQKAAEDGKVDFGEFSVEVYDSEGNFRAITDIMQDLSKNMEGMTQESKDALTSGIFNSRDLAGVNAMLQTSSDRFAALKGEIEGAEGAAQNMADVQLNNFEGQLKLLKSALEGLAIQVGNILMPYLQQLVDHIQKAVEWFSNLDEDTQKTIIKFAAIVAAVGPVLSIFGRLVTSVGTVSRAIGTIVKFVPTLTGAFTSLSTVLTGSIIPAVTSFATTVSAGLSTVVTVITGTIIPAIGAVASTIATGIGAAVSTIGTVITGTILPAIASLVAAIIPLLPMILAIAAAIAAVIVVIKNWGVITDWISEKWNILTAFLAEKVADLEEFFSNHGGVIGEVIATAIEAIRLVIVSAIEAIKIVVTAFGEAIKAATEGDWSKVGEIIQLAWLKIHTIIFTAKARILKLIVDLLSSIKDKFTELKNSALSWGRDFVQNFIDGITERMSALLDKVREMANNIRSYLHFSHPDVGPLKDANKWPKDFVEQYAEGIESARYLIQNAVGDVASDVAVLQNPMDATEMYDAIRRGASDATLRLAIGDREFGRALRNMGVVFNG